MVKQALLTLRRGHDLFMIFDAGLCREALGLPAQAASEKGKSVSKISSGSRVVGLGISPTADVAMADDGSGSTKKRKRNRKRKRKWKNKSNGLALGDINDAFADGLTVPTDASPLPGGGFISGGATTESSSTLTADIATRVLRARRSASRSPPPPRVAAAAVDTPLNFTAGDRVTFQGLVSRPELSGLTGSVLTVDSSTGRVTVAVSGMESIRVKPTNLRKSIF